MWEIVEEGEILAIEVEEINYKQERHYVVYPLQQVHHVRMPFTNLRANTDMSFWLLSSLHSWLRNVIVHENTPKVVCQSTQIEKASDLLGGVITDTFTQVANCFGFDIYIIIILAIII